MLEFMGADLSEEGRLKWALVVDISGIRRVVVKTHEPGSSWAGGRAPGKHLRWYWRSCFFSGGCGGWDMVWAVAVFFWLMRDG